MSKFKHNRQSPSWKYTTVHFTGSKHIWNWQSNIVCEEGLGFALTACSGSGGFWHCSVTQTQRSRVQKVTKHRYASCNIVMQYTCRHNWDKNVQSFFSVFQSGSERVSQGRVEAFHTSPGCCVPGNMTQIFNPFALCEGSRGVRALSQNPWLGDVLTVQFQLSMHSMEIKHPS